MSTITLITDERRALAEEGFYCIQDPVVGSRIFEDGGEWRSVLIHIGGWVGVL